ncbi:hypothetical protein J6590_035056 [Homalodisca vitripennis]|nr:hypothetical protein J6590_035056 [Homalodisca vitripennis]
MVLQYQLPLRHVLCGLRILETREKLLSTTLGITVSASSEARVVWPQVLEEEVAITRNNDYAFDGRILETRRDNC